MQTSGTFGGLSDGVKKTIVGKTPPKRVAAAKAVTLKPAKPTRRTK